MDTASLHLTPKALVPAHTTPRDVLCRPELLLDHHLGEELGVEVAAPMAAASISESLALHHQPSTLLHAAPARSASFAAPSALSGTATADTPVAGRSRLESSSFVRDTPSGVAMSSPSPHQSSHTHLAGATRLGGGGDSLGAASTSAIVAPPDPSSPAALISSVPQAPHQALPPSSAGAAAASPSRSPGGAFSRPVGKLTLSTTGRPAAARAPIHESAPHALPPPGAGDEMVETLAPLRSSHADAQVRAPLASEPTA